MLTRRLREWSQAILRALQLAGEAVGRVAAAVEGLSRLPAAEVQELAQRVETLERSRALWEAEVQGLLIKAEQAERNTRASEERQRKALRDAKRAEGADTDEAGTLEAGGALNGAQGAGEGMPPMRPVLGAPRRRGAEAARRAKWGI